MAKSLYGYRYNNNIDSSIDDNQSLDSLYINAYGDAKSYTDNISRNFDGESGLDIIYDSLNFLLYFFFFFPQKRLPV